MNVPSPRPAATPQLELLPMTGAERWRADLLRARRCELAAERRARTHLRLLCRRPHPGAEESLRLTIAVHRWRGAADEARSVIADLRGRRP